VLAHGWQIIPERGVVRSREPFEVWLTPSISLWSCQVLST